MTEPRPAVIFDVDGTLADVSRIRHYVMDDPQRKQFDKFHGAASYATPIPQVADLARALHAAGFAVLVLTSRKEMWRYRLKVWMRKWETPADAIGMRSDHDDRRDDDVKRDLHARAVAMGYQPVLAVDDNPIVVALWRSLHIPTVVVPGWQHDRPRGRRNPHGGREAGSR